MEIKEQPSDTVTLREWIITLILIGIPFLNFIMLLYWSLSKKSKASKKNYARASLTLILIVFVIYLITVELTTGYFLYKKY